MPYQVFGERLGAVLLMMAWIRLAMPRPGSRIAAIFASNALSPSRPRAAALWSSIVSFRAAFCSAVSPGLLADFVAVFFADLFSNRANSSRAIVFSMSTSSEAGPPLRGAGVNEVDYKIGRAHV